jgi:peptidoglycan/xylan/chitin deacetylase (PgdA/CDA1 family)
VKRTLFSIIRHAHRLLARGELPSRIALYFHELEAHQRDLFRSAVCTFNELGFRFVSLSDFLAARGLNDRHVFLSFDDNYRSWHESLPLLSELGVPVTFYVNTLPFRGDCSAEAARAYFDRVDHRGERIALTRSEVVELERAGHLVGCHSHSHFALSALPRSEWHGEIADSKRQLEDLLDREVPDFSWPYGMRRYFTEELRQYCVGLGFRTIAAAIPGYQAEAARDPFCIHRTRWDFQKPIEENLENLRIDGRLFERLTGRSAVG